MPPVTLAILPHCDSLVHTLAKFLQSHSHFVSSTLAKGFHITFLLRSPAAFEADPEVQPYIQKGQVGIVKGDATNADDVKRGWETAMQSGEVDLVLFTVGQFIVLSELSVSHAN